MKAMATGEIGRGSAANRSTRVDRGVAFGLSRAPGDDSRWLIKWAGAGDNASRWGIQRRSLIQRWRIEMPTGAVSNASGIARGAAIATNNALAEANGPDISERPTSSTISG